MPRFLEAELNAELDDSGWKHGFGLKVAEPVSIPLEGLQVQLMTDGSEIVVRRVGGNKYEFNDLCDVIEEQYCLE